MNKQTKGFVMGFIVAAVLMLGTASYADDLFRTIQIDQNPVNIIVNGVQENVPNFVYNGRTYIQLRSLGDLFNKNVSWDSSTNTAIITDKTTAASKMSFVDPASSGPLSTQDIAKKGNAVVLIETFDMLGELTSTGSGFIISPDGTMVTNYHVVNGASKVQAITTDQKTFTADVVNYNSSKDIAVLKLKSASDMPTVTIGDSDKIQLGGKVVAIGNPEGLQNVVSEGIISTISRQINGQNYIQITAPISPGSSGGALFDENGKVIGITAAYIQGGESLNFAVPINLVRPLLGV